MAKQLYCPHFFSTGGLTRGCLKGKFPVNCETCTCEDIQWIDVTSSTLTNL